MTMKLRWLITRLFSKPETEVARPISRTPTSESELRAKCAEIADGGGVGVWWWFKSYSDLNRGFHKCEDMEDAMRFIENLRCVAKSEYFSFKHIEMVGQDTFQVTRYYDLSVYD